MAIKNGKKGFTLIELLVVISIIALLMSVMMPSLGKARQLAKCVVCSNRLKQLSNVWYLYASDNNSKFPVGISWNYGLAWFHDDNVTKYFPSKSTWSEGADAQEVYKGYFCPVNEKLAELNEDVEPKYGKGYGTGYAINFSIGVDCVADVSKIKTQSNVPLFFDYYCKEDYDTFGDKPLYMGNYFCRAVDSEEDYESTFKNGWDTLRFMEAVPEVHGSSGADFVMVDGHVERRKPLDSFEDYGKEFTWDPKGGYNIIKYSARELTMRK